VFQLPLAHLTGPFAFVELAPMFVAAYLYAKRSATLASRGKPVPVWRQACFALGLLLIVIVLVTPISDAADELVIAHMIEHLMIGDLASLLIVLGLTGPLLQPILATKPFDKLRVLAHPAVALPLWALNFYAWHVPLFYDAAYGGAPVHALEHGMFIVLGCLMWMPIFGPLPKPTWFTAGWQVVYVIAVRFSGVILGNVLMWSDTILYPVYSKGEASWGISAVADQSMAGVVMMAEGTVLGLGLIAWFFFKAAREGIERQRLIDLAWERGVELDPARAQRAVAAGQSERLEKQIVGSGELPGAQAAGP
jgi:putative membrane protein